MALFKTRSDVLASKLKVRTRQLETINRFSRLRDQTSTKEEFLQQAAVFIAAELTSRFCAIVLKDGETLNIGAATMPEVAEQHGQLILDMAQGSINTHQRIVVNNTKPHPRLRAAGVACALAVPLWLKGQAIGAIAIFRFRRLPFKDRSLHTISTLADQLPASLDHVAAGQSVQEKSKELQIIYEVDKAKEKYGRDAQTLIDALAELLQKHTSGKGAFIFLFENKAKAPKFAATGTAKAHRNELERFARDAIEEGELLHETLVGRLKEGICVPVAVGEDQAALGIVNPTGEVFDGVDERIVTAIALQSDNALFEDREKKRIKEMFSRYVSDEVLEIILKDMEGNRLEPERHEVTLLFSDIRGFTALSEKIAPEKVVGMLNEYFTIMTDIILRNKGTLDKFVGDEIVALFGAPLYFEDHAKRAVKTALEMQVAFRQLQADWKRKGLPAVGLGIGLDSGLVLIGQIGGDLRADYTAIGDHVNTAARLCATATEGQVLMTQNTYDQVRRSCAADELAPVTLKGKSAPIRIFNATSIR